MSNPKTVAPNEFQSVQDARNWLVALALGWDNSPRREEKAETAKRVDD